MDALTWEDASMGWEAVSEVYVGAGVTPISVVTPMMSVAIAVTMLFMPSIVVERGGGVHLTGVTPTPDSRHANECGDIT